MCQKMITRYALFYFSDNVVSIAGTRIYLGRWSSYLFPFMLAIVKWDLENIQPLTRAFWQMVSMFSLPQRGGVRLVKWFHHLAQCSFEGKINKTNRPLKLVVVSGIPQIGAKAVRYFAFQNCCFFEVFLDVNRGRLRYCLSCFGLRVLYNQTNYSQATEKNKKKERQGAILM